MARAFGSRICLALILIPLVVGVVEFGMHGQSGAGGGRRDQVDHDLMAGQGLAAPIRRDVGEQPVLDLG